MGLRLSSDISIAVALSLVAFGGAAGGVARFTIDRWVMARSSVDFPLGTLLVNVSGALLIGFLAGLWWQPDTGLAAGVQGYWLLLALGVLGSYTTVSSFSLQAMTLLQERRIRAALLYIGLSFLLTLCAALIGLWTGFTALGVAADG
ncbi:MAG: CrcB family protein [Natronospirillum sp.]|uniref:fluoride efflux transporter FluC n=1 Tax=Natronospirillum sp. TaxID=2812955 RepID=UPI0025F2F526|nr:CrcB family protein [Natronospirillum sp.]MCH8552052.1 CrcB family protein [Natronospirillum sp.]